MCRLHVSGRMKIMKKKKHFSLRNIYICSSIFSLLVVYEKLSAALVYFTLYRKKRALSREPSDE